jgi:hypothetical protein
MIIQAAAGFQKSQVGADVSRGIRETNISRDQQVGTTAASAAKEKVSAAWESHAAKQDLWGRNLSEGVPPEIPIIRPVLSGFFQGAAISIASWCQSNHRYHGTLPDEATPLPWFWPAASNIGQT